MPPEGEGFVSYTIRPSAGVSSGTRIGAEATILFDTEPPISTQPIFNTIESRAPNSTVSILDAYQTNATFVVSWSGVDDAGGSGLANYDIFVSDNGAPYALWLGGTTLTEAPFVGQPGHRYDFYSIARDNAGNTEATPPLPTATVYVSDNVAPVLASVPDQTISVGSTLTITNTASDVNVPAQALKFSLDPSAPAGTMIATNGVFTWTPGCAQGSTSNLIKILVTDTGRPPLSNSTTFVVTVGECVQVGLGTTVLQLGQSACVPVNLLSTVALTNLSFSVAFPTNRFSNWAFSVTNFPVESSSVQVVSSSRAVFSLTTRSGFALQGPAQAGWICFGTVPGGSAFVPLVVTNIAGSESDGTPVSSVFGQPGRVVAIGEAPLLEASLPAASSRILTLYGKPGASYELAYRTNLLGTNWQFGWRVPLTNLFDVFEVDETLRQVFYRAWEFSADPPLLELRTSSNRPPSLLLYGKPTVDYLIESSPNLSPTGRWTVSTNVLLTNSFQFIDGMSPTGARRFFRAFKP